VSERRFSCRHLERNDDKSNGHIHRCFDRNTLFRLGVSHPERPARYLEAFKMPLGEMNFEEGDTSDRDLNT
jgi:hypothetical protein